MEIRGWNERIAVLGTKVFSSIWTFYAFFLWGGMSMFPAVPENFRTEIIAASIGWLSLFSLPMLAVGSAVLHRAADARADRDHQMIQEEFAKQNEVLAQQNEVLAQLVQTNATQTLILKAGGPRKGLRSAAAQPVNYSGTPNFLAAAFISTAGTCAVPIFFSW